MRWYGVEVSTLPGGENGPIMTSSSTIHKGIEALQHVRLFLLQHQTESIRTPSNEVHTSK
jgi:hypothetical protein